jgi:DNA-binding MarR family transcriptional regulator
VTSAAAVPSSAARAGRLASPGTPVAAGDAAAALQAVAVSAAALRASAAALEQRRDRAVATAIAAGATWTQIGAALGVSSQAAHKRFRGLALAGRAGQRTAPEPPEPPAPPGPRGGSVMVRLGRLAELSQRSSDSAVAAPFGLGRTHVKVVRELCWHGPLNGVELRRRCAVDKAGLSRAVRMLQRRGLIERLRDPDGGIARYQLTAAGRRHCAEDVIPLVTRRQNAVLRGLPADAVNVILDALMSNLELMLASRDS